MTSPLPTTVRLRSKSVAATTNVATTCLGALIVNTQAPPVQSPLHPVKLEPVAAVAVSVTLPLKGAAHVDPQSIPAGAEVTNPSPVPPFATVRVNVVGGGANVAVTDFT